MSLIAPLEKRTPASLLFVVFCLCLVVLGGALFAAAFWPTDARYVLAGRMAYGVVAGTLLILAGILMVRRQRSGLWLFALALLTTWAWAMTAALADGLAYRALLGVGAALGLIMLAFGPVARRRLVGVARPGYVIINGLIPLGMLICLAVPALRAA